MSFGQVIAAARRKAGLSQKDLANRIRKEDGSPISPQYLNDLERDRRNPPSEPLLRQFSAELQIPLEYLYFEAKQYPEDLRDKTYDPDKVQDAFKAFRKALRGD